MKIISINPKRLLKEDLVLITESLCAGKVAVLPTDTIYGLSCLANNKAAVKRIFLIKKRASNKPPIVLVASLKMAKSLAHISATDTRNLKRIWQDSIRPTTVILNARKETPAYLCGPEQGIALRLPKSDFLIKILRKVREPLISTSLNTSGEEPLVDLRRLPEHFTADRQPDLVVDVGTSRRRRPSRLIDLRGSKFKIIRK